MPFDFKKEYRDLYQPKTKPSIVEVPPMRFLAVEGAGDPNEVDGAYKHAIGLLYGVAYTPRAFRTGRGLGPSGGGRPAALRAMSILD